MATYRIWGPVPALRRFAGAVLIVGVVLTASGCGGDEETPPPRSGQDATEQEDADSTSAGCPFDMDDAAEASGVTLVGTPPDLPDDWVGNMFLGLGQDAGDAQGCRWATGDEFTFVEVITDLPADVFTWAESDYSGGGDYYEPVSLGDEAITFLRDGHQSTVVLVGNSTLWVRVPPDGGGDGAALARFALEELR